MSSKCSRGKCVNFSKDSSECDNCEFSNKVALKPEFTIEQVRKFNEAGHRSIAARMVDSMLKHYDGKPSAEWIDATKEKPAYKQKVIVQRPNKSSGKIDILIAFLYEAEPMGVEYGRGNGMGGGYLKTYKDYWALPAIVTFESITHWMPLPAQ